MADNVRTDQDMTWRDTPLDARPEGSLVTAATDEKHGDGGRVTRRAAEDARDAQEAPAAGEPAKRAAAARDRRGRRLDIAILLGLVLLACSITGLGVYRGASLSAFDEATHIDYVWDIAHGGLPHAGSTISPEILRLWSCHGQDNAPNLPSCGSTAPARSYPNLGENYNFGHPPVYYALTAAAAKVAGLLPLHLDFITVARLTGAAWLAAGLVGLYLLLRTWRVSRLFAVASAVLLASVPSVAHASSTVNNDAAAVLAGVIAFWALTRVTLRQNLGWVQPTLLTLFVASTKVINSVALLAVAGIVLIMAIGALREGNRHRALRLGGVCAGIVAAIFAVQLLWSAFQATRAAPGWVSPIKGINTDTILGNPVGEWLPTLFSTFGISQTFWLQTSLMSFAVLASSRWLAVFFTAAPFANIATFARHDARRLVGWAALVGTAAVPLVVQLETSMNDHQYFPNPSSRYGLSLLPLTIAAFTFIAHHRNWRVATVALSGCSIAALLVSFAGLL